MSAPDPSESFAAIPVAVIGFGGMGRGTAAALAKDPAWDLVAIADRNPDILQRAAETFPDVQLVDDGLKVIEDPAIKAVAITTLADARPFLLRAALAAGKHVWAEKPLAASIEEEEELLQLIESSSCHVAVNLFNRNAWYHERMLDFIADGEIGQVTCVRTRHQTPGMLPGGGHAPEGPPFHDCGMHYVDVARWYAASEFASWHAQGLCFWGHAEPWWVDVHGRFENGVVFSVTQGFIYAQESAEPRYSCGLEVIGTKGVMVMEHDFNIVTLDLRGHSRTHAEEGAYGGKKLNVMAQRLAAAINGGAVRYPQARDSVIASRVSWEMLDAARKDAPSFGQEGDIELVKACRKKRRELRMHTV